MSEEKHAKCSICMKATRIIIHSELIRRFEMKFIIIFYLSICYLCCLLFVYHCLISSYTSIELFLNYARLEEKD